MLGAFKTIQLEFFSLENMLGIIHISNGQIKKNRERGEETECTPAFKAVDKKKGELHPNSSETR